MNWKLFIFFLLLIPCFIFAEEAETKEDEEEIIKFKNKLTLSVSLNYREMGFLQSDSDYTYRGNKPLDLEFGLKYRIFSGSFFVNLPIRYNNYDPKPNSIDFSFDITGNKLLVNANYARYRSFYAKGFIQEDYINNLDIIFSGLSFLWIINNKNHSLKAIYELDRRQTVSNGSFLAGFGFYFNSILLPIYFLEDYKPRQHYIYNSPLFGYSYIFANKHGFFLNIMATVGINNGVHVNERKYVFMPIINSGLTIGYHLDTWSFTSSIKGNYHITVAGETSNHDWHHLYKMNFTVLKISKRFK